MAYQMYRCTTLGATLQETLDELVQNGQISAQLALKVIANFDKVINKALSSRVKTRVNFKADGLKTYRFCDNVWTLVMEGVEFKDQNNELCSARRVKIVACDGRASAAPAPQPARPNPAASAASSAAPTPLASP